MRAILFIQTILWIAVMGAILFAAAGTLRWPAGWIFLAEMGLSGLALGLWLARHAPGLLAERMRSPLQREQKPWDRVFIAVALLLWVAWLAAMALDARRYRLSEVPPWAQGIGALAILASIHIAYLTFRANSFAAPVVRVQRERAHRVVDIGPHAHVRHPLYAGAIFSFVGMPLLLGSWYGLALEPVLVALLAVRAVMEEGTLTAELDGYADYAARVRWRLVPFVW